jgi:hypothetical protein
LSRATRKGDKVLLLRTVSVAAIAAGVLGGSLGSAVAPAAGEPVATTSPAAERTYTVWVDKTEFSGPLGYIVVNTATHSCSFLKPLGSVEEATGSCSLESGEQIISGSLSWRFITDPAAGSATVVLSVHRHLFPIPVAYSGLDTEYDHDLGKTTKGLALIQLTKGA